MRFKRAIVIFSILGIFALYSLSILSQPADIPIEKIDSYEGAYVRARGTVRDFQILKYGSALKLCDGTSCAKVFIESHGVNVSAGDEVELSGRVERYKDEHEIVVLNERAIKILKKWNEGILFVSQLAQNPERYNGTNVKVTGKIGKVYKKIFYLDDESRAYSLRVASNDTSGFVSGKNITVSGTFVFDAENLQYQLDMQSFEDTDYAR